MVVTRRMRKNIKVKSYKCKPHENMLKDGLGNTWIISDSQKTKEYEPIDDMTKYLKSLNRKPFKLSRRI